MVHISKRKLSHELLEKLFDQLVGVFVVAGHRKLIYTFSNELFTKTEKIMFAKRLAAVLLLYKGVPQHIMAERLGMSPSTIAKLSLEIDIGKYQSILEITKSRNDRIAESILEAIISNLPPPLGSRKRYFPSMYRDSRHSGSGKRRNK